MGATVDLAKIERLLARPAKGDVSSIDSLAAIAAALLDIAREIDALGRVVKERLPSSLP
jgi:hypothetical protein